MKNSNAKEMLIIALKLLIICSIVAVIVASVNTITADRIRLNELNNTAAALSGIYSMDFDGKEFVVDGETFSIKDENGENAASCVLANCKYLDDVTAVYALQNIQGAPIGYCVAIEPMGFKDVIKMLVAINTDLTVKGVKIVSMSETSGIGTKANDKAFLSKFTGLGADKARNVDIISGATKTSKPIINAVANAVEQIASYIAENGGVQ